MKQSFLKIKKYILWMDQVSVNIKKHLIAGTLFGIAKVIFDLIFILQSKHMIDIATKTVEGDLWKEAYILVTIILTSLILSAINSYLYTQAENLMKNRLRERLFTHLMIAPMYKRGTYHSGDLTARLEEDVRIVTSNLIASLPSVVITGSQFIGAFWMLMKFDSHFTWIIVAVLPVFMITGKILSLRLRKMTKDIRNDESKIQSQIQEGLQHSSLFRALETETLVRNKFCALQNQVYRKIMKRTRFTLTSRSTLSLGFITGYLIAFLWGCFNLSKGMISFGVMTAFLQLVGKIQGPTIQLAQLIPGFIHATTSVDRLLEIESFKTETIAAKTLVKGIPGVRLENVEYTYPEENHPIFKAFSYDFPPGSHTAIIGPTGTGKTTLIRLILALVQPEKGHVYIYNENERYSISPATRCNISYVPQGNSLLSGTIKENLMITNPQATQEEIEKVLHVAVADFVFDLPEGLETMCGERGMGLSEGQAQRIAIARGLLKPASVLLLDEISASLDQETEALLFKRLNDYLYEKTFILITHRPHAAIYCNQSLQL